GGDAGGTRDRHRGGGGGGGGRGSGLPARGRWGTGGAWYGHLRGTAASVVNKDEPKVLIGSDQNGTWPGPDAANSSGADEVPPASRRGLLSVAWRSKVFRSL